MATSTPAIAFALDDEVLEDEEQQAAYRLRGFDGALDDCEECGVRARNSRESLDGNYVESICGACGVRLQEII